jgi:hypothetical protein
MRQRMGRAGLLYVKENHDWKRLSSQLVQIYNESLISARPDFV